MDLAVKDLPESRRDNDYSEQPCAMQRRWRVRVPKRESGRIQEGFAIGAGCLATRWIDLIGAIVVESFSELSPEER
jgi:hypothetical protein